ncbi:ABC transporter substrate-binding protein [Bradyrhizobium sp. ISRA443]|uniref:ABC transporter substrate-binding protein n=1 Tax=unclassified Bradyrhizobium TaxID=2631580 RepID=UPI002479420F|nr:MULTISPECIES: ABC transporter substrate-binding protein [unclassified Bradyrhizobium]WGR91089.1 ABC transporter substrate-binding protein [Bradyrhizobium sp. ISRA435]WGS01260.1 ABC transporter substrate-binding protein [Bradyrhizobium sp. ISRA436]WGS08147.1 ABC transporter substrate-binding protein [Bradyrhizobium sp. ISRA437]WGS15035.1 ABC transporter substrate-binding protein [Bradyrhizobium sp. ISRA443]
MSLVLAAALVSATPSRAQQAPATAADNDIRIGNIMPYTGPLAAFATIGRAEAAYFDMINEHGGINGRKIRFISVDDSSNPKTAMEQTRDLVEKQNVLLMFGSFGTPDNLATRTYLNEKKVPQLFVASGDEAWAHPRTYPWTMGWQPTFRAEGRIYANYIQASYPDRKIAVLWQNDQFGRDLFKGLQEGLGDTAGMIVADLAFDASETRIENQLGILKASGADILVFDGAPAIAARAIRSAADLDWHPVFILDNASASIASALRPAGLQNSLGVISTSFLKDASDASWKEDPQIKAWFAFMDKYFPDGDKDDLYAVFGYAAADTLLQVLRQCGDDLSRENIMRQAASLRNYHTPVALPGIVINTGPQDFRPIKQMRLVQFDGNAWQPIGDVIDSAFATVRDDN